MRGRVDRAYTRCRHGTGSYLKVRFGTPPLRLLLNVHGLVMTAWVVLFVLPGLDRLPLQFIENADRWVLFGLNDVGIAICTAYDALQHRRVHPAWVWGGAMFLGVQILTLTLRNTQTSLRIAAWMLK
jgi:hypothetical protein